VLRGFIVTRVADGLYKGEISAELKRRLKF
jgi:hypothetical protein